VNSRDMSGVTRRRPAIYRRTPPLQGMGGGKFRTAGHGALGWIRRRRETLCAGPAGCASPCERRQTLFPHQSDRAACSPHRAARPPRERQQHTAKRLAAGRLAGLPLQHPRLVLRQRPGARPAPAHAWRPLSSRDSGAEQLCPTCRTSNGGRRQAWRSRCRRCRSAATSESAGPEAARLRGLGLHCSRGGSHQDPPSHRCRPQHDDDQLRSVVPGPSRHH